MNLLAKTSYMVELRVMGGEVSFYLFVGKDITSYGKRHGIGTCEIN